MEKPSIAVLPFTNMSGDPEQDYFSDGVAEDIITDLSNVSGLFVLGRNTVFTYKGRAVNLERIAKDLGVSYLIEGSVQKRGQKVRINAQLIDGATGGHLWAARYDRDLTDVFAVQDEITRTIVDQLKVRLLPEERKAIEQAPTQNIEAYNFYLKGREFFHLRSRSFYRVARQMFARAIELDPHYARAYAGLAVCDSKLYSKFGMATSVDDILATAGKAIEIDPNLAEAHAARGFALNTQGRRREALIAFERALALDPNCYEANDFQGEFCFQDGDFERAATFYSRVMEIRPSDYRSPFALQMIFQSLGRTDQAENYARIGLKRAEEEIKLHPESSLPLELGAGALAALGERDRAMDWISRALAIDPDDNITRYNAACTYALLGEIDRALDILERWVRLAGPDEKLWFKNDPDFDPIKQHPRYRRLLEFVETPAATDSGRSGA
jgi:adenylate cyclase